MTNFVNCEDKAAVFIVYVRLVNHWVCLVAHHPDARNLSVKQQQKLKAGLSLTKVYLFDSLNLVHLNKENAVIPEVIMDYVKSKIQIGLKVTDQ
jgi:hypothetical protein